VIFNYFICFFMAVLGFIMLIFQKDRFKNIIGICLIWFSIVIFIVSLSIGSSIKEPFIIKEIGNVQDPFMENALVIFDIIKMLILTICFYIVSRINNKNELELNDHKEVIK